MQNHPSGRLSTKEGFVKSSSGCVGCKKSSDAMMDIKPSLGDEISL